jgi:hypothetical protein
MKQEVNQIVVNTLMQFPYIHADLREPIILKSNNFDSDPKFKLQSYITNGDGSCLLATKIRL